MATSCELAGGEVSPPDLCVRRLRTAIIGGGDELHQVVNRGIHCPTS